MVSCAWSRTQTIVARTKGSSDGTSAGRQARPGLRGRRDLLVLRVQRDPRVVTALLVLRDPKGRLVQLVQLVRLGLKGRRDRRARQDP